MNTNQSIELRVGQAVHWRSAPGGIAQICELKPKSIHVAYRCKNGRMLRPRVPLRRLPELLRESLLFALDNPLNLGRIAKSRTYVLETANA